MTSSRVTVRLVLDPRLGQRLIRESDACANRAARVTWTRVRQNIRSKDLIRTGHMMSSMTARRRGTAGLVTTYEVGSPMKYVDYQEFGTGPIYPVRAKALRFMPKGMNTYVFAARTRGVPARRFMKEALDALRTQDFLPGPGEDLQ
jgi:hypothetical protein